MLWVTFFFFFPEVPRSKCRTPHTLSTVLLSYLPAQNNCWVASTLAVSETQRIFLPIKTQLTKHQQAR